MDKKITADFKFMVAAHTAPLFKNLPADCVHAHELHVADQCSHEKCVCMCPDCVLCRNEDAGYEKPERGALDYEEVKRLVIENQDKATRYK